MYINGESTCVLKCLGRSSSNVTDGGIGPYFQPFYPQEEYLGHRIILLLNADRYRLIYGQSGLIIRFELR